MGRTGCEMRRDGVECHLDLPNVDSPSAEHAPAEYPARFPGARQLHDIDERTDIRWLPSSAALDSKLGTLIGTRIAKGDCRVGLRQQLERGDPAGGNQRGTR